MKEIVVIDYKIGNVDSVVSAIKILGYKPLLTNNKEIINNAKKIIMPGQGSFDFGMKKINELGILETIQTKILNDKIPTLGICLGMHLLAKFGYENNVKTKGLDCINGKVKKIESDVRLPHIGWSENYIKINDKIIKDIKDKSDFYYAHSFYFDCEDKDIIANSIYGKKFPSIIKKNNIYGVQFHPEKSLKNGLKILDNFLKI
jgi:glutamine amidotransferase|tara:strand:- start:3690 stop:4298 length:609 start_codon:yes stop_codon:yes gene_type:complete